MPAISFRSFAFLVAAAAVIVPTRTPATEASAARKSKPAAVQTGLDVLETGGFGSLRGKRVGLLSNPAGLNGRGVPGWQVLRSAPGVQLVRLFGAEHGFDGKAKAGIEVPNSVHAITHLPVVSLYGPGPVRKPTPGMLEGLDVLIYDIQDTGCRSYTFISTLGLAMEACAEAGVRFMVLDRPNPLGGLRVEGPGLDPRYKSFVGHWPIPYVYGLTPGELARMINANRWISKPCQLEVIPLRGWYRGMTWKDTGLRWVATSPNVPMGNTPMFLVATGVLGEIGGLDLGTGSSLSFQIITAPWLNGPALARRLNGTGLPGIHFEPYTLAARRGGSPSAAKNGVRVRITAPATAPLLPIGFHALAAIKAVSGRDLFDQAVRRGRRWDMFDKVTGSDRTRLALRSGVPVSELVASWRPGVDAFRKAREPHLLYPDSTTSRHGSP